MLIVCIGMIRSGSTLQYNIARAVIEKTCSGTAEGFFTSSDIERHDRKIISWAQDRRLHVLKTHELYPSLKEMALDGTVSFLYIYRDIRDVAVSVKNKFRHEGDQLRKSLDKALKTFDDLSVMEAVLWQQYERVIGDLPGAAKQLAEFLGLVPGNKIIEEVSEECSLERAAEASQVFGRSMRGRLRRVLHSLRIPFVSYDKTSLLHTDHISKNRGGIGVWQRELSGGEKDMIMKHYGLWLEKRGYLS